VKVLLVHPDAVARGRIREALEARGHEVTDVESGERAIDSFVVRPHDAVVVNLRLPGRDGAATVESLRWAPRGDALTVVLTGTDAPAKELALLAERLDALCAPGADPEVVAQLLGELPTESMASLGNPEITRRFESAEVSEMLALLEREGRDEGDPLLETAEDPGGLREGRDVEKRAEVLTAVARHEGRLEDIGFPFILARLGEQRASGALLLQSAGDPRRTTTGESPKKVVFFRKGVPLHVRSNLEEECLGRMLRRAGVIDERSLAESVRRVRAGDGRQGGILIAMGALTPHQLRDALERQQREKLFDIFAWPAGTYQFSHDMSPPAETVTFEMSLAEIVYRGVVERIPPPRLMALLEPTQDRYVVTTRQGFAGLERALDPLGQGLLYALDGRVTQRALLDAQPSRVNTARILYAAHALGVVDHRDAPEGPLVPVVEDEHAETRARIDALLERLRDGRYAAALGIDRTATPGQIEAAIDAIERELAPLLARGTEPELHRAAAEVVARVRRARTVLESAKAHRPLSRADDVATAPLPDSGARQRVSPEERSGVARRDALAETGDELFQDATSPSQLVRSPFEDETEAGEGTDPPVSVAFQDVTDPAPAPTERATLRLKRQDVVPPVLPRRTGRIPPAPPSRSVAIHDPSVVVGPLPDERDEVDDAFDALEQPMLDADLEEARSAATPLGDEVDVALEAALDEGPTANAELDVAEAFEDAEAFERTEDEARAESTQLAPPPAAPSSDSVIVSAPHVDDDAVTGRREQPADARVTLDDAREPVTTSEQDRVASEDARASGDHGELDPQREPSDAPHAAPRDGARGRAEAALQHTEPADVQARETMAHPDLDQRVDAMLQAERHFRRARRAIDREQWERALEALERAAQLAPDEGEFLAYLGWTRFQSTEDHAHRQRALQELHAGCQLVPKLDLAHLFHARALRALGYDAAARNAYERALSANPDCEEALRELRALDAD